MDNDDYLSDVRYIDKQESASYVNAARIIVKDYYELMDYVEPVDANKSVFSHRIYELLLRTATEYEANCKGILSANGYSKKLGGETHLFYIRISFSEWLEEVNQSRGESVVCNERRTKSYH